MVTMESFAQAFGFDAKPSDTWTTLGKVTAVSGNTLSVKLGGSSTATDCEAYCIAGVGDIVLVVITNGAARAVAVKGGGNKSAMLDLLNVGEVKEKDVSTAVSVANNTNKSLGSLSLEAGTWLVSWGAVFDGNATGVRCGYIGTSADTSTNAQMYRMTRVQVAAASTYQTFLRGSCILGPTSTTSYYLTLLQTSGSTLDCTGNIRAIRIG